MPTPAVVPRSPFVPRTAQPPYSDVANSTRAKLDQLGLTALRAMVNVEPYSSSDLGGDPSDDEPPSLPSASPSDDDDPEDPDYPRAKKEKKKKKSRCHRSQNAKAVATSKIVVNLPEFTRKSLSRFAENFVRFLRMTGQTHASGRVKCDLLLQCCKTKYLGKQVKQIVTKSATFGKVLVAPERQYPSYETDLSIRTEIQNLGMLPNNPKAARITELLADLDHWVGRLTPGSYGSDELLFWLVAKIPTSVWDECRAKAERKARTLTYQDLSVLLHELALQKESDQHLDAYRPGGGGSRSHGNGYQGPRPGQKTTPKHARIMGNVQEVFWCDARDEHGHLQHAPDGDQRDCFVVQGKKQETNTGSKPNMESTLEKIASCRYKTEMEKRSGFWQVDLTPNAQELLAFIGPQGRVFKWKVMPFGVANAPVLFQELMNKILSIIRRTTKVQELISRGAEMEAHIDDVCLGTNTQGDHLILLGEVFAVCQENHTRLKLEKCEFRQETMQYLGFDIGYGWWTPAASKAKPLMDATVRHEDAKKGLHDVRIFIGACNFTYTSAILTDLIKKSTAWRWGPKEQQAFDELKNKVVNAKCLGVPRAQEEMILVTNASNVGGGGTLFQWQALEKEEYDSAITQWGTDGLNRDGSPKHSYPDDKWVLVPLGQWNWKSNQARGNYSTYEQELLAGMLVLSSQARLLRSNPVVWLCDQEPVRTFQKGPPPEKAKLRRWSTYLSQLRLTVHHIQGVKNEFADYISRNNFNDLIGARSEALAKEAFSRMDVHLDLNMTIIRPLDGLQQAEYLKEFGDIYKRLEKRL